MSLSDHLFLYQTSSTFRTHILTNELIYIKVICLPSFIICFFQNVFLHNSDLTVTRLVVNTVLREYVTSPPVTAYLVLTLALVFNVKMKILLKFKVLVSVDKIWFHFLSVNTFLLQVLYENEDNLLRQ